jgi:energy-coupling factor transporter ATP-binding protein EcfA2
MPHPLGTLVARTISKSYGPRAVLDGVSVTVGPAARIGVVGPNGIGKSALLRVLAGLEEPDSGAVAREPAALTVGDLPQEPDVRPGESLLAYLGRRTGVAAAEAKMDDLAGRVGADPELAAAHAEALDCFLALGGNDLEARAREVAVDLGLRSDRLSLPLSTLSGGEAARAALAAIRSRVSTSSCSASRRTTSISRASTGWSASSEDFAAPPWSSRTTGPSSTGRQTGFSNSRKTSQVYATTPAGGANTRRHAAAGASVSTESTTAT